MDASTLVLPTTLSLTALSFVMSGLAVVFQIRKDRLPAATRFDNLRELVDQKERQLIDLRNELSVIDQKIQQRDRLIAEVSSLEERKRLVLAEKDMLEAARREISEVKDEAAKASGELAVVNQELDANRKELAKLEESLDPARIQDLKRKFLSLEQDVQRVEQEKGALERAVQNLKNEQDDANRLIEEAKKAQTQLTTLEAIRDRLSSEFQDLDAKRAELHELQARLPGLREQIMNAESDLQQVKAQSDRLVNAVSLLEQQRETLAKDIAVLQQHKDKLEIGPVPVELLQDLTKFPACLEAPAVLSGVRRPESAALQGVTTYLQNHGLAYSERTIKAFHTALKINDNSQLTVLAGVSGTGKSLLPRRYAEAMGIHFLQIAVEPRWDSPQDLLGFYNYIEKKYRATDLARLLVHMDPYASVPRGENGEDRTDHMSLVLLDEMNLARVEYYFSEFLSRLEARPRYKIRFNDSERRDALIPIDIRGLERTISLFPSHNVLFAGTMNDDESTQALSDKVLDRGNIMQFAAPRVFANQPAGQGVAPPREALSFDSWRKWVKSPGELPEAGDAGGVIAQLATIMESCGRPFGHRLRGSILAYVANYPFSDGARDVTIPLADQIEFRILPKLRGLEIHSHGEAFDRLENLLRDKLADAEFADRLAELQAQQRKGTGLFSWRGLSR